ncbi:MAG: hypothetical protein RLZZ58_1951 [Pseudomonadota bacterium]
MTHTAAILDFAAAPHALPPAVRADALRLLADTLAGGAAGAMSPQAALLLSAVRGWGQGGGARLLSIKSPIRPELVGGRADPARASTGAAQPVLAGDSFPAPAAAFFNGFAFHCLEWDAVHEGAVVHALSTITAALLAVSDRMGGSDQEAFLTSLAVGVDIASGIGLAATTPMRFFRPATAGVIGAALGAARLEGLNRAQMADVLGIACGFASGTMQAHVEASVTLPLQIANAAHAAVVAVDLARAGMNGPRDPIEGPFGYAALIEPLDLARYTATLGQVWRIGEVSTKPFPSGRASHGALGALQDMALPIGDVANITLHAPPLVHRLVGRPYQADAPMSYNRLCLAFLAPLMLRDGHIDPRHDVSVAALAERVEVVRDDNPDGNALAPQRLVVTMRDGTVVERVIAANLGSPDAPMSPAQSAAKYDLCRALARQADERIFDDPLAFATTPYSAP